MIFAFLSARLRRWVLLAVLLPLGGRLLEAAGARVGDRNPRAADALRKAGGYARTPTRRSRRRLR